MSEEPSKTKVVAIRFSPEHYAELEKQAQEDGLSISTHARRLILMVLRGDLVTQRQAGYAKSKGWE